MEGMLKGRCREGVSHLRNESSVLIPPAQQHLPFPCHMQQGWVPRSTAGSFLPLTAQLIPTDSQGVSKRLYNALHIQDCRN